MGILLFDIPQGTGPEEVLARLHGLRPADPAARLREFMVGMDALLAPETAERILREWGPFCWRRSRFAGVDAVLVVGVHTGTGSLTVRAAEGRGGVRVQPYGEWITRWRTGGVAWTARVMTCPWHGARWQGVGGCPHTAQALRVQEEFRRAWVA